MAVDEDGLAGAAVALVIGRREAAHRVPRADVVPAEGAGHHGHTVGFLHDGIVDGDVRCLAEVVADDLQQGGVAGVLLLRAGLAGAGGAQHVGGVLLQGFQHAAGGKAEHARVPQVVAGGQQLFGLLAGGLLDEANHVAAAAGLLTHARDRLAGLDVAVTRFRGRGLDAEGDQIPLGGQCGRLADGGAEQGLVTDQVVGRHHQHQGIGAVAVGHLQGRQGNGGGRVAAERLQQEGGTLGLIGQGQLVLVARQEEVLAVGHRQDLARIGHAARAPVGLHQQAFAVGQLHEGLGVPFTRDGPESGSGAAGQDDGNQHGMDL